MSFNCAWDIWKDSGKVKCPSLINKTSNNEMDESSSESLKLARYQRVNKLLVSGIKFDKKESTDQLYRLQHINTFLPNTEPCFPYNILYRETDWTRREVEQRQEIMKREERLIISSKIGSEQLIMGSRYECELCGRLSTLRRAFRHAVHTSSIVLLFKDHSSQP
jgi:hypothetical protein